MTTNGHTQKGDTMPEDVLMVGREAQLAAAEEQAKAELEDRIARLQPLGDRCLVRVVSMQVMSEGGLHIPEIAQQEKSTDGVVIRVGPGNWNAERGECDPMFVKVGDRVVFGKWTGSEPFPEVDQVMMFRQGDFSGIMHDEPID